MAFLEIDTRPLARMMLRVRGLRVQLQRPAGIMRTAAQGSEEQTRARIHFERRAPDGRRWRPWSAAYARTRKSHHSLLIDTSTMVDELDSDSSAQTAKVFSRQPYAGKHQQPNERPFLGWSSGNVRDIEGWLGPAVERLAADALRGR